MDIIEMASSCSVRARRLVDIFSTDSHILFGKYQL